MWAATQQPYPGLMESPYKQFQEQSYIQMPHHAQMPQGYGLQNMYGRTYGSYQQQPMMGMSQQMEQPYGQSIMQHSLNKPSPGQHQGHLSLQILQRQDTAPIATHFHVAPTMTHTSAHVPQ